VSCDLIRVLPNARLDDIATLQLRFASGAAGTLLCSWLLTGGYPGIRIRLHTSQGLAEVELNDRLPDGQRYVRYHPDGSVLPTADPPRLTHGGSSYTRLHLLDLLGQLAAPDRPSETLPTVRQAAQTQQVLEAALSAGDRWAHIA
jgi:predicted dehydrogenase